MFYLLIYIFLLMCCIISIKNIDKATDKKLFKAAVFVLWIILSVRYGQGTDYFAYMYIFNSFTNLKDAVYNPLNIHSEIGFRILCFLFRGKFYLMIFVISTFEMIMLYRFISRHSESKLLSLLMFFPTYYLTYFFSTLRQGIVIALFIGVLYDYALEKKWMRYFVIALLASTIHKCSFILLFFPLLMNLSKEKVKLICFLSALFIPITNSRWGLSLLARLPVIGIYFNLTYDFHIYAIIERIIMGVLIWYLSHNAKHIDQKLSCLINVYYFSIIAYMLISSNPDYSRVFAMFKLFEIIIIPNLLLKTDKYSMIIISFLLVLYVFVFLCKNLIVYESEGNYFSNKFYEYPYVTVFNKNDIWKYRKKSIYLNLQ